MKVISVGIFLLVGSAVFFSANYFAKGATYGWLQETWSGGADESAVANHTDNRTLWTKFFSKDDEVAVDGNGALTLSSATSDWEETDDADFNAGTKSDVYVSGGDVKLKKPDGASCTANDECYSTRCSSNICTSPWISGPCAGFDVYYSNGSGNWYDATAYCDNLCPTCDLPTRTELTCICNNKVSYEGNFSTGSYWSSTLSTLQVYQVNFTGCSSSAVSAFTVYSVRCIRR